MSVAAQVLPSAAAPRLRSGLVIQRQGSGEQAAWIVKEPETDRFFRFGNVEGFILGLLDGSTSLDAIRARVEAEFGATLPQQTLERFIDRLRTSNLLSDETTPPAKPKLFRGPLLYLRVKAIDPTRLLDWLHPRLRFFFTRAFVGFSLLVIFAGGAVTAASQQELMGEMRQLLSLHSLAAAWVICVVVILVHELAHGLTCRHFGGSVRELGLMLIFFQPAFYCNVSDAWLFPEKSKRLWVSFAGAYFELFLWGLATLAWRVTDPNTTFNYVCLIIVATSAVKSAFNLNPLIKLDGYYLLSDWLDIPNLRQRASAYVGSKLRWLFGDSVPPVAATPRERRLFWVYGVAAWIYSWWLLAWIMSQIGGYLVGRFQGWGFITFAFCVLLVLKQPVLKLLRAPFRRNVEKRRMRFWLKWAVRLCVVGAIVAVLLYVRTDLRIAGEFTILPLRHAEIRSEADGVIQTVEVSENDSVSKSDKIATLFDRDVRAELGKNAAEVEATEARLNLLKAGARSEELELARTGVAKAEERVRYARIHLEMDETLVSEELVSKRQLEETKELHSLREKELQEAKDKLKLLLAGTRKEEIDATEAELKRLKAQRKYLEEQLSLLALHTPISGIVTTRKMRDKVGRSVRKGDLIAEIHEMDTVTAEIAIPEKEIADVKVGQRVLLKFRSYPHIDFVGTVGAIAPVATLPEEGRAERTIVVTTQLGNSKRLLKPEMTGHAKIYCGEKRLLDIAARRLVRYVHVEFWSWW